MESERPYDVVIIGGALSGAATATLLLQQNPGIRALIVEKAARLTRSVGEAPGEGRGSLADSLSRAEERDFNQWLEAAAHSGLLLAAAPL